MKVNIKQIKMLLIKNDMTLKALAKEAEVNYTTLCSNLSGQRTFKLETLWKVSKVLKANITDLIIDE